MIFRTTDSPSFVHKLIPRERGRIFLHFLSIERRRGILFDEGERERERETNILILIEARII